jgi:beta-glucosidase/6-phospho-beta-glucosidase/beta-galactosidase
MSGFGPKFGIVAVDLARQRRTIKASATVLGDIARRNSLPRVGSVSWPGEVDGIL